jgi:magnesium transporter
VCQAGFLNLDFLFPRQASTTSGHLNAASPRQRLRDTRYGAARTIGISRNTSEDHRPWWIRKIWGRTKARPPPVNLPYSDEGIDASTYTLGRTMSAKAANEQKLRCTEFDENGNVVLVNGEFKKSELIAKVCCLGPFLSSHG